MTMYEKKRLHENVCMNICRQEWSWAWLWMQNNYRQVGTYVNIVLRRRSVPGSGVYGLQRRQDTLAEEERTQLLLFASSPRLIEPPRQNLRTERKKEKTLPFQKKEKKTKENIHACRETQRQTHIHTCLRTFSCLYTHADRRRKRPVSKSPKRSFLSLSLPLFIGVYTPQHTSSVQRRTSSHLPGAAILSSLSGRRLSNIKEKTKLLSPSKELLSSPACVARKKKTSNSVYLFLKLFTLSRQ